MKLTLLNAFSAILLLLPIVNFAQAPPTLGTASDYALFTAVGAFNNSGATTVTGDVGTNVGAFNAFPPGVLVGQIHVADPASAQAATDVNVAYSALFSTTCGVVLSTTLGNGQTLNPGVYCLGAASTLNGNLVLDGQGDPSSLFIFKIDGALSTSTFSNVVLTNGAALCNVYWQINGQFQLGDFSVFRGTIVANGAIILLEGSSLFGRGLSREGAISLHNNVVTVGKQTTASTIAASGPTTFCPGGSVILSGNTNGGTWSTGATTSTITVSVSGDYFITSTGSCGGSVSSNHIIVTVNAQLSCTITGNSSICTGQSTQLCVPASASSKYLWSTGATTNCIAVSAAGTYSVTITNADGCVSTCSKTVSANSQSSCSITGNDFICCPGRTTQLCVPVSPSSSYLWNTGATTNCITVSAGGTYSVSVNNGGCISTCQKTVTVASAPVCTIAGNSNICQGTSTQLCSPYGAGYTYLWSTGATSRCITVNTAGNYSLTVSKNKLSSMCSKTVTVTPSPSCTMEGSSTIYPGQTTQLCVPASNASTYLWSTGATTNCISITTAGNYSVSVTNAGCTSTCQKTVTPTTAPSCVIEGNDSVCPGGLTLLCGPLGSGYTYLWNTGSTSRCLTVNAGGAYSLTVFKNGGSITCTKTVTSSSAPCCPISGNSSVCVGGSTPLCGPSGTGFTYLWSTGSTSRCITADAGGTYSLTVTKNGSSSTCSKTVEVAPLLCGISGNNTICTGGSTSLCAPSGNGYTYLWNTGETSQCVTVNAAGTSTVTVTRDGCSTTCSRTVNVSAPSGTISGNASICEGTSTSICGPIGYGYTYLWNTGATSRCLSVSAGGSFSLKVTAFGCSTTGIKTVTMNPNPDCSITGNLFPNGGQTTTLCAPDGLASYVWNTGATTRCITVDCAGTYTVVTNSNDCRSYCSTYVTYPAFSANATARTIFSNASVENYTQGAGENIRVKAYPNPFNSTATIEFQNTESNSLVVIELYNLSGNKVSTLFNDEVEKGGLRKVEVNAADLPSGTYVYRITNGYAITNKKLILLRR